MVIKLCHITKLLLIRLNVGEKNIPIRIMNFLIHQQLKCGEESTSPIIRRSSSYAKSRTGRSYAAPLSSTLGLNGETSDVQI